MSATGDERNSNSSCRHIRCPTIPDDTDSIPGSDGSVISKAESAGR